MCHKHVNADCVESNIHRYGKDSIDRVMLKKFAGCEIIRRLIGVAQLPIEADLDQRLRWLRLAKDLVLKPS